MHSLAIIVASVFIMPDIFVPAGNSPNLEKGESGGSPLKVDKHHSHLHLFTAYCENPPTVKFADKLENEELLLFLRKHFVTNVPWIVQAIGFLLVPILIGFLSYLGILSIDFLPERFQVMILLFYYFLVMGFIFVNYITWFYNISLVTNKRIIDIDFSSIVFENVAATKLTQVEDVSYSQVGVIRSIFDYGDLTIQTAGTASEFDFLAIPHPEKVINVVNNLIGRTKHV